MTCPAASADGKRWHRVKATIVNGQPIVINGQLTGALPGHVVAPGAPLAAA